MEKLIFLAAITPAFIVLSDASEIEYFCGNHDTFWK